MILLDTHVVVWLAQNSPELSRKAISTIAEARKHGGGIAIADITLWELAMLATRQRIQPTTSVETFLHVVESTFVVLPLTAAVAHRSTLFTSRYPNDPADRIIGATAIVEGLPLLTRDERIRASKEVPTI
jgi:PIN domain nuclease of toxin-antitoxin system